MLTDAVIITNRCNQNCRFCNLRSDSDPPDFGNPERIISEMKHLRGDGADRIALTGGEPGLDPKLPAYVRIARQLGYSEVVVETNGKVFSSTQRARRLVEAGLTRVRIAVNAIGTESDEVTRDPGGWNFTLRALRNFLDLGLPVELSVAVTPMNAPSLPDLPDRLFEQLGGQYERIERAVLRHILEGPRSSDDAPVSRYSDSNPYVLQFLQTCASYGFRVSVDPANPIPPCTFDDPAEFLDLTETGAEPSVRFHGRESIRAPACGACSLQASCPGFPGSYAERFGVKEARTLAPDDLPARIDAADASGVLTLRQEFAHYNIAPSADGRLTRYLIINPNYHCNQDCEFCFVYRDLPQPSDGMMEKKIEEAARKHIDGLTFMGGEPTLNRKLPEHVRLAKSLGIPHVMIFTNGLLLSRNRLAHRLKEAGLDSALVSLHGSTDEVSDAITRAPGTFQGTLEGADALLAEGIPTTLNHAVCERNYRRLPEYADFVHRRFGNRVSVNFCYVTAFREVVPTSTDLIPRFSDVRPFLREAVRRFLQHRIEVVPLASVHGIPACFWDSEENHESRSALPLPKRAREGQYLKAPACDACRLNDSCYGVHFSYAKLYGLDEVKSFGPVEDRDEAAGHPPKAAEESDGSWLQARS